MQYFVSIKLWLFSLVVIFLNGCISTPVVETQKLSTPSVTTETPTHHTVKPGDTLYGIAKRYGHNYKDIARWNQIVPPYYLIVGQRLQLSGPPSDNESVTSTAAHTPHIDRKASQNRPVTPKKPQQKKTSSKTAKNNSLNLRPVETHKQIFGDLVGEKHKVLRKKNYRHWRSFSARFKKQGIRHKATSDAKEKIQLRRFIVDIEGDNCDQYRLRYFSVNDKSEVRRMFPTLVNRKDTIGIVKIFDGKENFLYLQVDNEYAFRISGKLLIHLDTGRFVIQFDPIENSQRLFQALINGNSLFFGAREEDDFIFTSTYSLQGFTKALFSTIDACKTIGN